MKNSSKQRLRSRLYQLEEQCGTALGHVLRPFLPLAISAYALFVGVLRVAPDRLFLWTVSGLNAFGAAAFDRRGVIERDRRLSTGGKMRLDIAEKTQRLIYSHPVFETNITRFVLQTLRAGDTFVDVGANVGYFTILAAPLVGDTGSVIAFEPERHNFELLERNVALNQYGQVVLNNCAVGADEGGTARLNINPLNHGGNSLLPFSHYAAGAHTETIEQIRSQYADADLYQDVPVRSLDAYFKEALPGSISLMKIDVEGFEREVLRGMSSLLKKRAARAVICEVNNAETRAAVFARMAEAGYLPHRVSFEGAVTPIGQDTVHGNVLFVQSR